MSLRSPSLRSSSRAVGLVLAGGALVLSACSGDDATASTDPAAETGQASVSVRDPWVKAVDTGMTSAFGIITNPSDTELVLVEAATTVASEVELHDTVDNGGQTQMRELETGFVIPADGEHELAPGGDHLMLMGVDEAIRPGDVVTFTLTFDDGSTLEVDAPAKDFSGAQEEYAPETDGMHEGDDHAHEDGHGLEER